MSDDTNVPDPAVNPPARALSRMAAALSTGTPPTAVNPAEWMFERLKRYIQEFESHLDDDHEVGAHLVAFGHELTFHIRDMGYHGPDIITFYGQNERGEDVQLVQHTSQLNVLLVAVRKQQEQPRRIGFVLENKESSQEQAIREGGPQGQA
jgi:hypothetical protein